MKKGVGVIAICIVAMMVLTGCTFIDKKTTEEQKGYIEKCESEICQVSSCFYSSCIGDTEVSMEDVSTKLHFINQNQDINILVDLPEQYQGSSISAGNKTFYVSCVNRNGNNQVYLRMYNVKGEFEKEIQLPFQSVLVEDGLIFGAAGGRRVCVAQGMNISKNSIEATHYIDEKTFLEKYPTNIEEWTKMDGGEEINVGEKIFYRYSEDNTHSEDYYRDAKIYPVQDQTYYVLYCDGECRSAEDDRWVKPRLKQIYSLMLKLRSIKKPCNHCNINTRVA